MKTRAFGTLLSWGISYLVFIHQCILQQMRTADVSKMSFHPHAGEGLLSCLMLFNCSHGFPRTLASGLPSFWSRKMWKSRGRGGERTAWSSVPAGFPGTSIWVSKAADQISSWGHAVLGLGESGCWSEQLGDTARVGDGHTRTIEPLAQFLSQWSMSSRTGSIGSQRMLCVPVLGTEHMLSSHILSLLETSDIWRMRRTGK